MLAVGLMSTKGADASEDLVDADGFVVGAGVAAVGAAGQERAAEAARVGGVRGVGMSSRLPAPEVFTSLGAGFAYDLRPPASNHPAVRLGLAGIASV